MKIRQKGKEESVLEKRNTALFTFISIATVPLLLTFLLGMNLGYSKQVNAENLHKKVIDQNLKIDSLNEVIKTAADQVTALHQAFIKADSVFENFKAKEFTDLETKLDAAKDEISLYDWDKQRERVIIDFRDKLTRVSQQFEYRLKENPDNDHVFDKGKQWLVDNVSAKDMELFALKLYKKQAMGIDVSKDLEEQMETLNKRYNDLNQKLKEKEQENFTLNQDLKKSKEDKEELKEELSKDATSEKEKVQILQKEIDERKEMSQKVKIQIQTQLDNIKEILLGLQGKRLLQLKNTEDEVDQIKEKVENKLTTIERTLLDLD